MLDLNRFGNVLFNVRDSRPRRIRRRPGRGRPDRRHVGRRPRPSVSTCPGDVESGEWGLIIDPRGWALVIGGDAANAAGGSAASPGDPIWLTTVRD